MTAAQPTLLQKAAIHLRAAEPRAWEGFTNELERMEYDLQVALTRAPAAEIMGVQGKCQQMAAIIQALKKLPV